MADTITLAIDALASAAFIEGGVSIERTNEAREYTEQRKRELIEAIAVSRPAGGAVPPSIPGLSGDAALAYEQCRAVVHLALAVAEVYSSNALIVASDSRLADQIGAASAEVMEYLGDTLNSTDATTEEDEWLEPIFEGAQERWPVAEYFSAGDLAEVNSPQEATIEGAAYEVGKWLNERPNRPIDLRHVAMLVHYAKTQAEVQPWKDHMTAQLVNQLVDVAKQFHGAQQLRERIAEVVCPLVDRFKAEVQAEPVALQMCSDLKPRTDSEKAAYLAGVADGRMYAERDADTAPQAQPAFQQRVQPWMMACFGAEIAADRIERNHRFLEEALELVQSTGCTQSEAHQLVDYVYGRPWGEPAQEVGGVMVTLAALCLANGLDMHQAGETELARVWTKVEAIRAKQAAKPKHSPLPQAQPADALDAARYRWLARKVSGHGVIDGWAFGFPTHLTLPAPSLVIRDPEAALGQAIDAAMAAAQEGGNAAKGA